MAVWGLVLALVIGALVRLWDLPSRSLYLDEAFVFEAARMPVGSMLNFLADHDAHPPLFYLLTHALAGVLAWPHPWFRFLTAPFGLVTIACTWLIARRAFGDAAAAAAAIVVATEPTLVLFDRMYRMYTVLTALSALSFVLLSVALTADGVRRRWWWAAYAIVVIVLLQLQYLGVLIVLAQCAYALMDARRRWPVLACAAIALCGLLPWSWLIARQIPLGGFAGGHAPESLWTLARDVLGYAVPVDWYRHTVFDVPFTLAVIAVVAAGSWLGRKTIAAWYAAPALVQTAATLLFHRNLLYGRYLIYLVPAFSVACGAVTAALLRGRFRVGGVLLMAGVLALNGAADTDLLLDKFYQLSDWNTVEQMLSSQERRDDAIVFDQVYALVALRDSPFVEGHDVGGPQTSADVGPVIRWIDAKPRKRVWYVENQRFYSDPDGLVKKHLDATRPRLRSWLELRADPANIVYVALYGPQGKGRR